MVKSEEEPASGCFMYYVLKNRNRRYDKPVLRQIRGGGKQKERASRALMVMIAIIVGVREGRHGSVQEHHRGEGGKGACDKSRKAP